MKSLRNILYSYIAYTENTIYRQIKRNISCIMPTADYIQVVTAT
jgi:hypothetical protein